MIRLTVAFLAAIAVGGGAWMFQSGGVSTADGIDCPALEMKAFRTPLSGTQGLGDRIQVQLRNPGKTPACDFGDPLYVTITPRDGEGFFKIHSKPAGWSCDAPAQGSSDAVECTNPSGLKGKKTVGFIVDFKPNGEPDPDETAWAGLATYPGVLCPEKSSETSQNIQSIRADVELCVPALPPAPVKPKATQVPG